MGRNKGWNGLEQMKSNYMADDSLTAICPACGEPFERSRPKQIYCRLGCRLKAEDAKQARRPSLLPAGYQSTDD
jgi:hypothetical protein